MKKKQKPGKTQVVQPSWVIDPDTVKMQRELERKTENEKRHLAAQLPAEARATINKHPRVSANTLAEWLQKNPATKNLVGVALPDGKPMLTSSLAKKIGRYRSQQK